MTVQLSIRRALDKFSAWAYHRISERTDAATRMWATVVEEARMVATMGGPRYLQSGEAAAALGVSVELLRKYERLGRIAPPLRTARGVRLYTPEDVETIRQVREALQRERAASAA